METQDEPTLPDGAPPDLVEEVRRANRGFYRAFESLDIDRMRDVWLRIPGIKCVHPGWKPLFEWEPIMESWQGIFSNTGYIEFDVREETIFVNHDLAVVWLFEVLGTVQGGQAVSGSIHATNVFLKRNEMWKMIAHHAS